MGAFEDFMARNKPAAPAPAPVVQPVTPTAANLAQVEGAIADPKQALTVGIATERGSDQFNQNQLLVDSTQMSPIAFIRKYGEDVANKVFQAQAMGQDELLNATRNTRTGGQQMGDIANDAATALVGGIADAATLPVAIVAPDAGRAMSGVTDAFREGMGSLQSGDAQRSAEVAAIKSAQDAEDNLNRFEEDRAEKGDLIAGMEYLGRGAMAGITQLLEDPMNLEKGLAQAAGSLLAAGPVTKGVTLGGTAVLGAASKFGLLAKGGPVATAAAEFAAKAATPLAIGAMEGGGAYTGTVQEVMGMTHEDLLENSPSYRSLIDEGVSQDEAKEAVADRAGLIAGAIQGPIGAVTGIGVAKFEGNLFGKFSPEGMVRNILNETVEETLQSGSSPLAQNLAVQQTADENRLLIEGVGEQAAQGGLLGSMSAGLAQAPRGAELVGQEVFTTVADTVGALKDAIDVLATKGAASVESNRAASGVTLDDAVAAAPVAAAAVAAVGDELEAKIAGMPEEQQAAVGGPGIRDRLNSAMTVSPEEVTAIPATLAPIVEGFTGDRLTMMRQLAKAAYLTDQPKDVRTSAALELIKQQQNLDQLFGNDLNDLVADMPHDSAPYMVAQRLNELNGMVANSPEVQEAMEWARTEMDFKPDENGVFSPETTANIDQALTIAPDLISREAAEGQLLQDENKTDVPSARRRAALRAVVSMHNSTDTFKAEIEAANAAVGYEATPDETTQVAKELMTGTNDSDWKLSISQHAALVNKYYLAGNIEGAKYHMKLMGNLGWQQLNKSKAAVRSLKLKDKEREPFARLGSYGRKNPVNGTIRIHAHDATSMALARTIHMEAEQIYDLVEQFGKDMPEIAIDLGKLSGLDRPVEFFGEGSVRESQKKPAGKPPEGTPPAEPVGKKNPIRVAYLPAMRGKFNAAEMAKVEELNYPGFNADFGRWKAVALKTKGKGITWKAAFTQEFLGLTPEEFIAKLKAEYGDTSRVLTTLAGVSTNKVKAKAAFTKAQLKKMTDTELGAELNKLILLVAEEKQTPSQMMTFMAVTEEITRRKDAFKGKETKAAAKLEAGKKKPAFNTAATVDPALTAPIAIDPNGLEALFPDMVKSETKGGVINRFISAFRMPKDPKRARMIRLKDPLYAFHEATESVEKMLEFVGSEVDFAISPRHLQGLREFLFAGQELVHDKTRGKGRASLVTQLQDFAAPNKELAETKELGEKLVKDNTYNGGTFGDAIARGEDVQGLSRGRATTLLHIAPGTDYFSYNPALVETGMLAFLDWVSDRQNRTNNFDKADLAKKLGVKASDISEKILEDFNRSNGLTETRRGLADHIMKFWGLSKNPNIAMNYSTGTAEALAAEIMRVAVTRGWMFEETLKPMFGGSKNVYVQYSFADQKGVEGKDTLAKLLSRMGPARKLIALAALPEEDRSGPTFGSTPIKNPSRAQLHNKNAKLTRSQQKAQKAADEIKHYHYVNGYDMFLSMGAENLINLRGMEIVTKAGDGKDVTKMNIEHRKSIEGKNRSILMSLDEIQLQREEFEAHAEALKLPVDQVEKHFPHDYTKTGRQQYGGGMTVQNNQMVRSTTSATKVTVDLSDPNSRATTGFFMAIAQGLGAKVNYMTNAQKVERAKEMVSKTDAPTKEKPWLGKYGELVTMLEEWLEGPRVKGSLKEFTERVAVIDKGITDHGFLSLLAAAEYNNAVKSGANLKSFDVHNYFEADGVGNGPMNTLMNMTRFASAEFINLVAKGGVFFGSKTKTMQNMQVNDDLYTATGIETATILKQFAKGLPPGPLVIYESMIRVMGALDIQVGYNGDGDLVINRNVIKNPLTITLYGSGAKGIAGNIVDEMMSAIYSKMTDTINAPEGVVFGADFPNGASDFWADFNTLVGEQVMENVKKKTWYTIEQKDPAQYHQSMTREAMETFSLGYNEYQTLRSNIEKLFVNKMIEGMDAKVTGHVKDTLDSVQKSLNAQSIILSHMVKRSMREAMYDRKKHPENYPGYKQGDALTPAEIEKIVQSVLPFGAKFSTPHQNYFIGAGIRDTSEDRSRAPDPMDPTKTISIGQPKNFSTALDDSLSTGSYADLPGIAGVSPTPTVVIGTGDGRAIDIFLTQEEENQITNTVLVFDGINFSITDLFEGGRQANRAVFTSWTENPIASISEGFNMWLRQKPLEILTNPDVYNSEYDQMILELSRNETGNFDTEILTVEKIISNLEDRNQLLKDTAVDIGDRIRAMKMLPMTVDQMAGTNEPHVNEGTIELPENATPEYIAEVIDKLIAGFRAERAGAKAIPAIQGPSEKVRKATIKKGNRDRDTGVLTMSARTLDTMRDVMGLSEEQAEIFTASMANIMQMEEGLPDDAKVKIVFGTPEQVTHYEENTYPRAGQKAVVSNGKYDHINNVIYINNNSPETIVHELIHVATVKKVRAYYDKDARKFLSAEDQAAIYKLEGLMNEWSTQTFTRDTSEIKDSHAYALSAVDRYRDDRPADALNEFLAWSLSNQHIIKEAQKTDVKNPLFKIIYEVLEGIKNMIWGRRVKTEVGNDIFSNVRFNTQVLMATETPAQILMRDFGSLALFQSTSYGQDDRLSQFREKFFKNVAYFINEPTTKTDDQVLLRKEYVQRKGVLDDMIRKANLIGQSMTASFGLTPQQAMTFSDMVSAIMVSENLDKSALTKAGEVFTHVLDQLTIPMLMPNPDLDRKAHPDEWQEEYAKAAAKFDAINGIGNTEYDAKGRSSLLPSFIALATVDDSVRLALSRMEMPDKTDKRTRTVDVVVEDVGNKLVDGFSTLISGQGLKNRANVLASIDALVEKMTDTSNQQRGFIEQRINNGTDALDEKLKGFVEWAVDGAQEQLRKIDNPIGAMAAKYVTLATNMFTAAGSKQTANQVEILANNEKTTNVIRDFLVESMGRTDGNKAIFDNITKVKTMVDQTRQKYRTLMPAQLKSVFKTRPSEKALKDLFVGFGQTDAAHLFSLYDEAQVTDIFSSGSTRKAEIAKHEADLKAVSTNWATLESKMQQLADYMLTGNEGHMLQSNAYAIASLNGLLSDINVKNIDTLVSLYAIDKLGNDTRDSVVDMLTNENEATMRVFYMLKDARANEEAKISTIEGRMNNYKGNMLAEAQDGASVVIMEKSKHAEMLSMDYVLVSDYKGSSADPDPTKYGVYYSTLSGRPTYNQGVMQTARQTVFGVDPETGFSMSKPTGGVITDPEMVRQIDRRMARALTSDENLRPIYGDDNRVIAYERSLKPEHKAMLNQKKDVTASIGMWKGRQFEELQTDAINSMLVDDLHAIWKSGTGDEHLSQFVDISKSKDPTHVAAWTVIPAQTKKMIKKKFGNDGFMIKRGQVIDAVGVPSATIGDLWTGNGRWKPAVAERIRNIVMGMFPNQKGYSALLKAEKGLQGIVSDVKTTIVIRSVIVPAVNAVSGITQLMMTGVPLRSIIQGYPKKIAELNLLIQTRQKELALNVDLEVATTQNRANDILRITRKLQVIQDTYKHMSIYPILHEFGAIMEGNIEPEDTAIANGGFGDFIDRLADKLPQGPMRETYRYGMVTKDTALFKALARATQYGDFIAKAVLYDDLINRRKKSKEEAMAQVNEDFVQFGRFPGRSRGYLDSIGMSWFYHYKIRSMKTAQRQLQEHPFRSLMSMLVAPRLPFGSSVGTSMSDNLLSLLLEGKGGNSLGLGMATRAYQLNPWLALQGQIF